MEENMKSGKLKHLDTDHDMNTHRRKLRSRALDSTKGHPLY